MSSMATEILRTIENYSYKEKDHFQRGAWEQALQKISKQIAEQSPIRLILPAFPLKNPNRDKTLGPVPDLGEELALARLDRLCSEISQVYQHGARLSVISDGVVYGDLMGVDDSESFQYGQRLRSLAAGKEFRHITFLRVSDVLGQDMGATASMDAYTAAVPRVRKRLETFLGPQFDVEHELDANEDTMITYRGFVSLLATDMRWGRNFDATLLQDEQRYDQEVRRVAKCMVKRLVAYENLLREKFSDSIRLSIHQSKGKEKIYIPLLPGTAHPGSNPWNCCVSVMANGDIRSGHAQDFSRVYDLVEHDRQPYFFRERSAF